MTCDCFCLASKSKRVNGGLDQESTKKYKSQDFCLTMAETKAERKLHHVTIQLNIPAVLHIGLRADMQMFSKNQYVPTVMATVQL